MNMYTLFVLERPGPELPGQWVESKTDEFKSRRAAVAAWKGSRKERRENEVRTGTWKVERVA